MRKRKKRVVRILRCPIVNCKNWMGFKEGITAICNKHHYPLIYDEVKE